MTLHPLPDDPTRSEIEAMLDLRGDEWWLTRPGSHSAFVVESMKADGSDHQTLIAVTCPVRLNNGDEETELRLLISPEDALGLAHSLHHAAMWLQARGRLLS